MKIEINSLKHWIGCQDVVGLLVPVFIVAAEYDISRQRLRQLVDLETLVEYRVFNIFCVSLREFRQWQQARSVQGGRPCRKTLVNKASVLNRRSVRLERATRNFLQQQGAQNRK